MTSRLIFFDVNTNYGGHATLHDCYQTEFIKDIFVDIVCEDNSHQWKYW